MGDWFNNFEHYKINKNDLQNETEEKKKHLNSILQEKSVNTFTNDQSHHNYHYQKELTSHNYYYPIYPFNQNRYINDYEYQKSNQGVFRSYLQPNHLNYQKNSQEQTNNHCKYKNFYFVYISKTEGKVFVCMNKGCDKKFYTFTCLLEHIQSVCSYDDSKKYECHYFHCNKKYKQAKGLNYHLYSYHIKKRKVDFN